MKQYHQFIAACLVLVISACKTDTNHLSVINSQSFPENQINLYFSANTPLNTDSIKENELFSLSEDQNKILDQLDEMLSMVKQISLTKSDSDWVALVKKWDEFQTIYLGTETAPFDTYSQDSKLFPKSVRKWAELNVELTKLSEEARFCDAIEKMLYGTGNVYLSEKLLKSVVYTHVFDQIYVNIIGSSSMHYQHTTGGDVKIIQETNYPLANEMTLKTECDDYRYMDIFIRIPSWALNPTVTHGLVKYVAIPGQYCEISRKWKTGDEIKVVINN